MAMRPLALLLGVPAALGLWLYSNCTAVTVPAEVREQSEAVASAPPPILSGMARQETARVEAETSEESLTSLVEGADVPRLTLDPLFSRVVVVNDRGCGVDPKGLIGLLVRATWADTWLASTQIKGSSTRVPVVENVEQLTLRRCFPLGAGDLEIPDTDLLELSADGREIRVTLRGWVPVEVLLPPPEVEGDGPGARDFIRLELSDGRRFEFRVFPAVAHAVPLPVGSRVSAGSWERTGPDEARGELDVYGPVLTWMGR